MKQIGFIGAGDKKDLLLNVAKIISKLNKTVLIVDATIMQRLRYVIPKISSTPTYVSEYDGIDVAVGFMNLEGIAHYLGKESIDYEYVLIDTDNPQTMRSFLVQNSKINFYVTSYDEFELKRSLEILSTINTPIELTKVLMSADINENHDEYLNHLLSEFQISWSSNKIEFVDTDYDRSVTLANQLTKQISIKNYSSSYKDGIEYFVSIILEGELEQSQIRRYIKKI